MSQSILRCAVALGLPMLLLGGCARTEPARFYLLRPVAEADVGQTTKGVHPIGDEMAIAIEAVELSAYLDRPEIATRRGLYQVQFADFDRWAEPLADNIAQVLADNLSVLLRSEHIYVFPLAVNTQVDYRLTVDIARFDNEPGEGALLRVHWMLRDRDERRMLISRKVEYREPLREQDYESIAAGNSRLLARLSRDIAEAVRGLPGLE